MSTTQIFSRSNVIIFLTGSMKLLASLSFFPVVQFCLFPGDHCCAKTCHISRGLTIKPVQTWPRTALGYETGSVYILNYSFVSRWLCALASLGVGSGFLALGPGVRGLFSGIPRVLRWRKIFKPVKT